MLAKNNEAKFGTINSLSESNEVSNPFLQSQVSLSENERQHLTGLEYEYFALGGLMTLSTYFIMVAESDDINLLYPGMNYSFLSVTPQYFAVPFGVLVSYLLRHKSLRSKILIFLVLTTVLFFCIPLATFVFAQNTFGFVIMMICYFAAYSFAMILQGFLVASCALFPSTGTVVLFTFQPIFNIILMLAKLITLYFELSVRMDYVVVWGLYLILAIALFFIFLKISVSPRFKHQRQVEHGLGNKKETNFKKAFLTIKFELLEIFVNMFITFLIFPGIIFSLSPKFGMSAKTYINITNLIAAFSDLLGRPLGDKQFNKVVLKIFHILGLLAAIFIIYVYLTGVYLEYPGMTYVFFVLNAFIMYRTATGITYLMVTASKKAEDDTQEAIGVLMTNVLITGIAVGNLISLSFPSIKSNFF